jgi:glyoxylase-like metal-dependent hydrolase (beta-lactamase superfamily II)
MLRPERHDDVTRLAFTSVPSRLMGFGVSAFVVRGALVDCAFAGVRRDLRAWLAAARPDGLMLTHWHEDHAGNVQDVAAAGLAIAMPPGTEERVRAFGRIQWYRRACWGVPTDLRAPVVPFGHDVLRFVATPGHSPDHHVVWDPERDTVFGGDLFIGVKVRIAHHDEDLRAQVASLRAVAELRPRRFFDAHRGAIDDPVGQLRAKADWIEATIAAIEDRARRGWDERRIRDDVLGREDRMGIASRGAYSRLQFVRNVLRGAAPRPNDDAGPGVISGSSRSPDPRP